jgi:hypothetical protein
MLARIFAVAETLVLAVWIGGLAGFAFVFAPIAFRLVTDLDRFATITSRSILSLTQIGYVCGTIAIVAAFARSRVTASPRLAYARIGLIVVAMGLSAYDANTILPQMQAASAAFGVPFDDVPKTDPRRVAYAAMHQTSSRVLGGGLLRAAAALALAAPDR